MVRHVLGRDRGFLVVTEFLVLCRDRGFPMSRHGSQAAGSCLVATYYFHVMTVLSFSITIKVFLVATETAMTRGQVMRRVWPWAGILYCDKVFLCRDIV